MIDLWLNDGDLVSLYLDIINWMMKEYEGLRPSQQINSRANNSKPIVKTKERLHTKYHMARFEVNAMKSNGIHLLVP